MQEIRLRLDDYLEEKGMTRYELAKKASTNYQIIDNYYKNKVTRYDRDILLRICVVLDCGIEDILIIAESES